MTCTYSYIDRVSMIIFWLVGQVIGIVFAVLFGGGLLFIAVYSTSGLAIACVCYLKVRDYRY